MKRLSIIIVTYKSERDIYDCLQSVWQFADVPKDELEVIIVDNSSECEPMFTRLRQLYGDDIILIHNTHNGGYGQGNNVGIRQASAPIVLIMNPDVRLCMPVFAKALQAFDDDPELCMYGMKQMLTPHLKSPLSFDCSSRMNGYLAPFLTSFCNKTDCYVARWMHLAGSCFFIHKEKFAQVGLFDETIFMYAEEEDIHWRMQKHFGTHVTYNKHLRYVHLTLDRPSSVDTERKMLASIVASNEKKGVTREWSMHNRLRFFYTRYVMARLRHKKALSEVLLAMITELREQLSHH